MPKYDYHCSACDATFEVEQRMSDDPLKKCQKCGSEKVERLIGGASVITRGGTSAMPEMPTCPTCDAGPGEACPYR